VSEPQDGARARGGTAAARPEHDEQASFPAENNTYTPSMGTPTRKAQVAPPGHVPAMTRETPPVPSDATAFFVNDIETQVRMQGRSPRLAVCMHFRSGEFINPSHSPSGEPKANVGLQFLACMVGAYVVDAP
jgi:hypothetical protein